MPKFAAIKINYDHRALLRHEFKYSTLPTLDEYNDYLSQFDIEGIGGNGFHECLNFKIPSDDPVKFYLPPTCLPSRDISDEEFVFFSFTYKGDKELPSHIIGVHAGVSILSTEPKGISRGLDQQIEGVESLQYHAESPAEFVTILSPPISYKNTDGIYTPAFQKWGNGLRYIDESHATNIISNALQTAIHALDSSSDADKQLINRQIEVLQRISDKYSLDISNVTRNNKFVSPDSINLPDKEIGYLGEKYIYEREIRYVKSIGCNPKEVEWFSQVAPTSPFDIRTLRQTSAGVREHFIEVKSSVSDDTNIYVSSGQISFFKEHQQVSTFAVVKFNNNRLVTSVRDLTFSEITSEFDFVPIKFKLSKRS